MKLICPSIADDLAVEIHHPRVVPDDAEGWMTELAGGLVLTVIDDTTHLGWPIQIAHGGELDAADEVVAHRVAGFFRFFHLVAAVVVHGGADELAERAPEIIEALRSARPDFRGDEVNALAEVWSS